MNRSIPGSLARLSGFSMDDIRRMRDKLDAERSLYDFIKLMWPVIEPGADFVPAWHMEAVSEHLEAVTSGEIKRLLINICPGFSKSLACNVFWPAWEWGPASIPEKRYLAFSYSQSLTVRDNKRFRQLITSPEYTEFWGDRFQPSKDQFSLVQVENDKMGWKMASSVSGVGTGARADVLLCFPADQTVVTEHGPIPIGEIVKKKMDLRVWSTDVVSRDTELKRIVDWKKNPGSEIIEIGLSDGLVFRCTPNHKIWTEIGWEDACDLDTLIRLPLHPVLNEKINRMYDRTPKFVRKIGEVSETFCLTVEENHTFYVGDYSKAVLVKNCDDPNSVKEAESESVLNSTNQWFTEVLPTRLNNPKKGAIVVIQQRTNERDVSGLILERDIGYENLSIPMEYDGRDLDESGRKMCTVIGWEDPRTEMGELCWPAMYPRHEVEKLKHILGPYAYSGQMQQMPAPRSGGLIERGWWKLWDHDYASRMMLTAKGDKTLSYPPFDFVLVSCDTAYTEKEENDPSACTVWGVWRDERNQSKLMLMHGWQGRYRLNGPPKTNPDETKEQAEARKGLVERIADTAKKWDANVVLVETKASGISVIQEMQRLYQNEKWGLEWSDPGKSDKYARTVAVQPIFSQGLVYAPNKDWAEMVITQVTNFPKAKHDDLHDTVTMACTWLRKMGLILRPEEEKRDMEDALEYKPDERRELPYDV